MAVHRFSTPSPEDAVVSNNRDPPLAHGWIEVQHVLEIAPGLGRALSVRLVDDEDVGDLEQAGFAGLDGVPPAGGHHHDRGVSRAGDLHLHLAHADGLNQDGPPAGGSQHADRRGSGDGQPALVAPGGHRPDEHPVVQGVPLHADAVAQNGATGEGRRRIHREHADPTPPGPHPGYDPGREGGLPGAGSSR